MTQLVSPVSQKRINKVLAKIEYMSGLLDSTSVVKHIVFRGTNKGGTRLLIRGGDYCQGAPTRRNNNTHDIYETRQLSNNINMCRT